MNIEIEFDEKPASAELCRLCANTDNHFIPIFQGEGIEHNIAEQIKKYLPIVQVTEVDELPLQVCYQCTSTLLAWHNFFEHCRVADNRLRELVSENVKFEKDDESYHDFTDDFRNDFEDQAVISDAVSDNTEVETILPVLTVGNTQMMEISDNDTVDICNDLSESVSENFNDNRFARKTTNEQGSKEDVCLAPKATASYESGEECGSILSRSDALLFCECSNGIDKTECTACAKNEGRSVRCQHCPMVFLSADQLARHVSNSHNERHPTTSSPRESVNTKAAGPNVRSTQSTSEKDAPLALGPKVKVPKVEVNGEPLEDVEVNVEDSPSLIRVSVSPFQCPDCPKAYKSARSLKRHSAVHQRLAVFSNKNEIDENSEQNGQLVRDSALETKNFIGDLSADETMKTEGEHEFNSDEPSFPRISTPTATVDAGAVTFVPKSETNPAEPPVSGLKTVKRACRSGRRSAARSGEEPPSPSLPMDTIVCSVCRETYDDEATFAEHQRSSHGGAHSAVCDVCELQFPTPTLLRAHKIANHRSRRNRPADEKDPFSRWYVFADAQKHLKCDQCNYNSLWYHKGRFLEHYRIHTGERPYACDLCGKRFRTRTLLHKHVTYVHKGVKEHACDLCGRRFSDKRYMEDHRRIHTGERPYVCDLCGKTFKQSASLFIHKELHKGLRKFACDMCGKRFTTRSSLNIHIKRHVGERNFVCAVCGKAFVDGKHLRDHSTVHSDERPFGCELCGARFKLMKHLKQHGRTHKRDFRA